MFDNEINFLSSEVKQRKSQNKKSPGPLVKPQILYTKPEKSFQEKQEITENRQTETPKKPNFFKKAGSFFSKFLKSKSQKPPHIKFKKSPDRPDVKDPLVPKKNSEPPAAKAQPGPDKIIEPIVAKSTESGPENKVKDIFQTKPSAHPKKEMPPGASMADITPEKQAHFTTPSISKTNQQKEAGVNLMPEDVTINIDFKNKILVLVGGVVFVAVIIGLSFLGIRLYSRSFVQDSVSTQEELLDIEDEINIYEEYRNESQDLSEKIDIASNLIKAHKHWSKLFPVIESITHSDILYSNFLGDVSGQVTLSPSAPGFKVVAQQILILKDSGEIIDNFDVSEIGLASSGSSDGSASGATFNLTLKFNPDFFLTTYE